MGSSWKLIVFNVEAQRRGRAEACSNEDDFLQGGEAHFTPVPFASYCFNLHLREFEHSNVLKGKNAKLS